jgi:hypothetical protein
MTKTYVPIHKNLLIVKSLINLTAIFQCIFNVTNLWKGCINLLIIQKIFIQLYPTIFRLKEYLIFYLDSAENIPILI